MSINSINSLQNTGFNFNVGDPIKPETRAKLKELGLDNDKSIRTETQAQAKIQQKTEEIKKQIQERIQADAANQNANNGQNVQQVQQPQNVGNAQNVAGVDGINQSQHIQQPKEIEGQNGIQNNQTGNEQLKAFAGSNSIQQPQQSQPFEMDNDLKAMYNKLKLGLV